MVLPGPPPPPAFGPPYEGTLPAYCRASGVIDERIGRNGRPYAIGYLIALPVQWNGRFLFQGGGGFNGTARPPVGPDAVGLELALSRGFAVVSTDSGHTGAVFDGTFFEDQEATVNFLYRAIDKVTVVAKKIIAIHYGRAPEHSLFHRLLDGRPRGNADVAALSALLRRHCRRRARHAYELLRDRGPLGGRRPQ